MAKAEGLSCRMIMKAFSDYSRWTGQSINRSKSCVMFSKKVPTWKARRLANMLGVRRTSEFSYLGVPLKLKALRACDFDPMLQHINNRLHGWGVRHLSMAGRVVLINSVLLMGPVYLLSHCLVPNSVLQLAEKAARTFLWNGSEGRGMHYIAWEKVCCPKVQGGLGIHSLIQWRKALLSRLAFRFLNSPNCLLNRCLSAKYGRCLDVACFKRADSSAWRLVCCGYQALANVLTWEVGDGSTISFYTDKWLNGRSLNEWPTFVNCNDDFPLLLSSLISVDRRWNLDELSRLCGDSLVNFIAQVPISAAGCLDSAALMNRYSGCSVSSFVYRSAWHGETWEYSWIWKLRLRPKEAVFWWRACHDAIPTGAWLRRRGLGSEHSCPWGCDELEDLPHIMIHCKFITEVFRIFCGWGFSIPGFTSVPHLLGWLASCSRNRGRLTPANFVCSVIYQCWSNRIAMVHGRPFATPLVAASLFLGNISCGPNSPIRFWGTNAFTGDINPLHWCPPPRGWLKANFDGALYPNGRGGFALVIRDHDGNLVKAMGAPVRHWDSSNVEMMGFLLIKEILGLCSFDAAGLIIEGDNICVINHIKVMAAAAKNNTLDDTFYVLTSKFCIHNIIVSHVVREQNLCADCAAHIALGSSFVWDPGTLVPQQFCNILQREKYPLAAY